MFGKRSLVWAAIGVTAILLFTSLAMVTAGGSLEPKEELGKSIYFDQNLSVNRMQACASCHAPEVGWTGPVESFNEHGAVHQGAIAGRFGDRKPPSAAYATQSPIFHWDKQGGLFIGGNFWDGRATGDGLGNPAADQAQGPFLNAMEHAFSDSACVVYRVCNPAIRGDYPVSFEQVWGAGACDINWPADVDATCAVEGTSISLSLEDRSKSDLAYDQIALAIAAFEASPEVNAFSSKYDQRFGGKAKLTKLEQKGYALFRGKGQCSRCHTANGQEALFTDYSFDNLGIPKNPENPVYDRIPGFVDPGLGGFLESAGYSEQEVLAEWGKHKVPTVRNVDLRPGDNFVKAYGHNGYFKSLEGIVHFYNTRDVKPACPTDHDYTEAEALKVGCWPAPEVAANVNVDELGDLGLSAKEEAAIVAFLKALSDGYPR